MNPEARLARVGNKMLIAAIGSIGFIRVCWLDGEFQCLNSSDRRAPEFVIARFRAYDIVSGLSSKQWESLSKKIAVFLKKRGS